MPQTRSDSYDKCDHLIESRKVIDQQQRTANFINSDLAKNTRHIHHEPGKLHLEIRL